MSRFPILLGSARYKSKIRLNNIEIIIKGDGTEVVNLKYDGEILVTWNLNEAPFLVHKGDTKTITITDLSLKMYKHID